MLAKQMDKLDNALLCKCWNCIRQRFDVTSKILQDIDLAKAVDLVAGLRDQFDSFETAAKEASPISQAYKCDSQNQTRQKHADEPATHH